MDEKTLWLGTLSVAGTSKAYKWSSVPIARGQSLRLPDGCKLTPLFDANCGHLTFEEFPRFHMFARSPQRLNRFFQLKWKPGLEPAESHEEDDLLSDCQKRNLERTFESIDDQALINEFFQVAKSNESYDDRQTRFETGPLWAFKGLRKDLTAYGGFQYCVKKKFEFKDIELCKKGGHACLLPWDVFDFNPRGDGNVYFRVLIEGAIHGENKSVAKQIELVEQLSEKELAQISGVFETPKETYLQIRGVVVGVFDHFVGDVWWSSKY